MKIPSLPTAGLLLLVAAVVVAGCGSDDEGSSPDPIATGPGSVATTQSGDTTEPATEKPDSGGPVIVVDAPEAGTAVSSPVTISGNANVFEATVSIALTDADGNEIASTFTTATCGSGCRGDYSTDVEFEVDEAGPGTITVYSASAEDGSRQHVVEIPVTLKP